MGRKSLCMYQHIVAHLLNTFLATGVTGNVTINENGDRSADYSLLAMDPETGNFTVMVICMSNKYILFIHVPVPIYLNRLLSLLKTVAKYHGLTNKFEMTGKIYWPNRDSAPPDKPECGFNNELCEKSKIKFNVTFT